MLQRSGGLKISKAIFVAEMTIDGLAVQTIPAVLSYSTIRQHRSS
jgi:hypothetical protein